MGHGQEPKQHQQQQDKWWRRRSPYKLYLDRSAAPSYFDLLPSINFTKLNK